MCREEMTTIIKAMKKKKMKGFAPVGIHVFL
jgi:hypothetical protein